MSLSEKQKRELRRRAHHLKPVVMVGAAGLTESVVREAEHSLTAHELIKVRIAATDRNARDRLIGSLCTRTGAMLVQRIGNVVTLFRRNPDKPRIPLSA